MVSSSGASRIRAPADRPKKIAHLRADLLCQLFGGVGTLARVRHVANVSRHWHLPRMVCSRQGATASPARLEGWSKQKSRFKGAARFTRLVTDAYATGLTEL